MVFPAAFAIITGLGMIAMWTTSVYLIAMGMLFYTVIVSPGYFAQKGQWGYVVMFGVILILALASLFVVL